MPNMLETLEMNLARGADEADALATWPAVSWAALMNSGVAGWSIPRAFGGQELGQADQLAVSELISSACLTTAFILSQREAAIRHVLRGPEHLKQEYLPELAQGKTFITIGLSQLTTSRQHQGPALRVEQLTKSEFKLHGEIPWVTGAPQAKAVVVGATLDNGEQALFLLPTNVSGVTVDPILSLSSLVGSQTSSVRCENVLLSEQYLLAGPKERVLGGGGGGGLETSCLALGLTKAATNFLREESKNRIELVAIADRLELELKQSRAQMLLLAADPQMEAVLELRAQCTLLALRSSQAALLFAKGKGFVQPHPAQRWSRQALFFLVWSCPRSVTEQIASGLLL